MAQLASGKRAAVEALVYAALIGLAVSRSVWRSLRTRAAAARRVSERRVERRVTDALAAIAGEIVSALLGDVPDATRLRKWHRLLSRESLDPNVGRATLKRGWAC